MFVLSDLKFNKNIPSSTVNSIGLSILDLCQDYSQIYTNDSTKDAYKRISNSDYLQEKYLQYQLASTLVNPINYSHLADADGQLYSFKYSTVSVESLMRKILKNEHVLNKVIREQNSAQQRTTHFPISTIEHCSIWPRLKGKLKMEIFIDDAQIAPSLIFNKNQKYILVYATFPDIPYEHRVSEDNIEILLMANRKKLSELTKTHKLDDPIGTLLRTIADEMKHLMEKGIEVSANGVQTNIKLALSCICGDNAGIYELLGNLISFIIIQTLTFLFLIV